MWPCFSEWFWWYRWPKMAFKMSQEFPTISLDVSSISCVLRRHSFENKWLADSLVVPFTNAFSMVAFTYSIFSAHLIVNVTLHSESSLECCGTSYADQSFRRWGLLYCSRCLLQSHACVSLHGVLDIYINNKDQINCRTNRETRVVPPQPHPPLSNFLCWTVRLSLILTSACNFSSTRCACRCMNFVLWRLINLIYYI